MSKIAVIYWSGTGNTEAMARAIEEGAASAGADVECVFATDLDVSRVAEFDAVAFGCPAMGAESLEETEFEPIYSACEAAMSGRRAAFFGSCGWGVGEWLANWEARAKAAGLVIAAPSVRCKEAPDAAALEECRKLGEALAKI